MPREYHGMKVVQVLRDRKDPKTKKPIKVWEDQISAPAAKAQGHLERLRWSHGKENVRFKP
jgi:hypothetical protein